MKLNKQQLRAISVENKNVLISAGAGSGKTRVLVERIVNQLINNKLRIDELLAMTFTRDAASEMKNRIKDSLLKAVSENEDKTNILSQLYLLQNSNISTIDSFCKRLVDENFSKIDNLDPNYRIADEKEINLIMTDSINTLLNNIYEEIYDNKYYKSFIKCYFNKDDSKLREIFISGIYFLNSKIYPEKNLKDIINNYDKNFEDYYNNVIIPKYLEYANSAKLRYAELDVGNIYNEIKDEGNEAYFNIIENVEKLKNELDKITNTENHLEMSYDDILFVNVGLDGRTKNVLKPLVNFYKDVHFEITKFYNYIYIYKKSKELGYFSDKIYDELLLKLYNIYENNKKENNIIEISDLQKYAIRLLIDENGNFTDIAKKLQDKYKQIYIDEYQDTNDVQETLIRALSDNFNKNNVFMVGDVKQSIYGFRNSKPDLFNEKFKTYSEDQSDENKKELIMLNTNYRCDKNIIDFTNNVFNRIMTESYSNINYSLSKLNFGKGDIDKDNQDNTFANLDKKIEVNVLIKDSTVDNNVKKKKSKKKEQVENEEEPTDGLAFNIEKEILTDNNDKITKEDEARFIANRIKELHDNDGVEYKDIAILARSTKSLSDIYIKEFSKFDIPIVAELKSGFYISYEIRFMLNLLAIIDNPMDDIALSSVLTSKLYNINNNELAFLKLLYKNYPINFHNKYFSLYDIVSKCDIDNIKRKNKYFAEKSKKAGTEPYIIDNIYDIIEKIKKYNKKSNNKIKNIDNIDDYKIDIDALVEKINKFLSDVKMFRYYSRYKSISELINIIYEKTYIYNFAASLLNGKVRIANLDLLFDIAKNYESTSYVGLYNFIRFIEKMRERDEDEGMAQVFSKNENVVRMMTIHKSKGLEFPIVIMPKMNQQYNNNKSKNKPIVFDNEYGPALNFIDYKNRIQLSTSIKDNLDLKNLWDENKEEQRLMYVAFTRAKEKLIFSYICNDESKLDEKLFDEKEIVPFYDVETLNNINNYCFYLKAALSLDKENIKNHNSYIDYREIRVIPESIENDIVHYDNVLDNISEYIYKNKDLDLTNFDTDNKFNYDVENNIKTEYEYQYLTELGSKFSVSQIKHIEDNYYEKYEKVLDKYEINDNLKYALNNRIENNDDTVQFDLESNDERMDGSQLGTIYHKFMQNFDFQNLDNIPKEIDKSHLEKFLNTDIAKELRVAYTNNNKSLFTEQRFMKMFKYTDILDYKKQVNSENDKVLKEIEGQLNLIKGHIDPNVVVQGVIDVFYIKTDSKGNKVINIIDYKTDGLINNKLVTEDGLKANYEIQLKIYKKAVEDITKIKVDKCYIYSFSLDKFIEI